MPDLEELERMGRLGRNIRERRKAQGMTLAELAGITGVSPGTLWTWENGKNLPHPRHRVAVVQALGLKEWTDLGKPLFSD